MAKQSGPILLEGTYGNLTCYRMEGQYYVRRKSSLTSKKFWKHKSFEGSRKSCNRFGEGNQLASKIYRMIEEEKRAYMLFCFLKKRAIALLKEGKDVEEAEMILLDYLQELGVVLVSDGNQQTADVRSEAAIRFPMKGCGVFENFNRFEKLKKCKRSRVPFLDSAAFCCPRDGASYIRRRQKGLNMGITGIRNGTMLRRIAGEEMVWNDTYKIPILDVQMRLWIRRLL